MRCGIGQHDSIMEDMCCILAIISDIPHEVAGVWTLGKGKRIAPVLLGVVPQALNAV